MVVIVTDDDDACGRCGDIDRATKLLGRMHEDGIVADGVVYSSLVAAFSAESSMRKTSGKSDLPGMSYLICFLSSLLLTAQIFLCLLIEWANGASVDVDWNKIGKVAKRYTRVNESRYDDNQSRNLRQNMMNILSKVSSKYTGKESEINIPSWTDEPLTPEKFVTETIDNHISFGENLLEIVYPGKIVLGHL